MIVNPLDSSSDIDAWESETGSLVGSAPTKTDLIVEDSIMQTQSLSHKEEEYFSSCEEETDDSYSETDSEPREESLDRDGLVSLSSANTHLYDIKRYSGDCERVTELLSEHDRTKNRKQYQVTKARQLMDKPDLSLSELNEVIELGPESTTAADEYFNTAGIVESFVNDLLEQAADHCDREENGIVDSDPSLRSTSKHHRRVRNHTPGSAKAIQRDSAKRHSSTSKTSSDSNRSNRSLPANTKIANNEQLINDSMSGGSDAEPIDDRHNFDSVDSGVVVGTGGESLKSSTTTATESTKKETAHQISWRKTQQTVETSIKNAEILRQNAETSFIRQSSLSMADRKRHFDRLHPFHTHMLLYFGVYDTKQVLYSFQTLRNIIACDCRTFLCFSITTSVPTAPVRQLLVR